MTDLARLPAYTCPECKRHGRTPARLACPGICPPCGVDARREEATMRLAGAVKSIHPERRWARALDLVTLGDRLREIRWWRILRGGNVMQNGSSLASLIQARDAFDNGNLVISGRDTIVSGNSISSTGIGKTSIAVAIMREVLDGAVESYVRKDETPMHFAACSRFVSAIDLTDTEVLKTATGASLLVLDDAGQEGKCGGFEGERRRAIVGDLLDRRERSRKQRTIVTTFMGYDQWIEWYAGRVTRLYWEDTGTTVLEVRRTA